MPKQQSDGVDDKVLVDVPAPEKAPEAMVQLVCPHDGKTYPCYRWAAEAMTAIGWRLPEE